MCGIVGFSGSSNRALLESMCRLLTHRGPDDEGYFEDDSMNLAMRRLAIIDLAGGHQPIANEDQSIWTVFNGEIYNYESVRKELESAGHTFRTRSDTETIVHAYEEYGVDFLNKLRGMFGIAVWDQNKQRLILGRDRIGEKPLYYAEVNGQLAFASEIKSVLKFLPTYSVDFESVHSFLSYGFVPEDRTLFNEVKKLRPGWYLDYRNGEFRTASYWSLSDIKSEPFAIEDAESALHDCLLEAVQLCMKSDVEVGAFLSGGLDSSLLSALIKQHGSTVKTFSVGFSGAAEGFNELNYAREVSEHVGTEHHELILEADSSIEDLPTLIWHYDEPHGEPTSALVYKLSEYTRQHVKVAVGGNGADELFLGYPRHKGPGYLKSYQRIPQFLRRMLIEPAIRALPESTSGSRFAKRARRFVNGLGESEMESYINWTLLFSQSEVSQLLSPAVNSKTGGAVAGDYFRSVLSDADPGDFSRNTALLDLSAYLPEYQLCYMDRMSMAASIEVRAPFCDYKLIELVHSFQSDYRLRNGVSKYLLKAVAEKFLPNHIVHRKKVGFDSPFGHWLKTDLQSFSQEFLSKEQLEKSGLLNPEYVSHLLRIHNTGERDLSMHLWSIIALETWFRMYFELPLESLPVQSIRDIRGGENFTA